MKNRTAKARQVRLAKQAIEWEKRLERMGLGLETGNRLNRERIEYGQNYYPDTVPFNYAIEPAEEERIYLPKGHFWPGTEDTHVNYRSSTVGGQI